MFIVGYKKWSASVDENSYISYKITFLVEGTVFDGPTEALACTGLPVYGDPWAFGDDEDLWAWMRWECEVSPELENETNYRWLITYTFSTKPPSDEQRPCSQERFQDPLLEPMKLSGSFVKYTKEATQDMHGNPILTSSVEPIRGDKVTFDNNRPQVVVEQNVLDLQYGLLSAMVDSVNAYPIWGFDPRMVKLSDVSWERKFYGTCSAYFTRRLTFDIDTNTFDRNILDEGTKVLHGHWDKATGNWELDNIGGNPPDPDNPRHFDQAKDRNGENIHIMLNGEGQPAGIRVTANWMIAISDGSDDLSFQNQWMPVNGNPPTIQAAEDGLGNAFEKGDLFTATVLENAGGEENIVTTLYIATRACFGGIVDVIDPANARAIGPSPPNPINQGNYIPGTTYATGSLVQITEDIKVGNILVQYYPESDFFELGVPLTFDDFSPYPG